jgi:hypothetical protein
MIASPSLFVVLAFFCSFQTVIALFILLCMFVTGRYSQGAALTNRDGAISMDCSGNTR